ncbi:MAG: efflux transporter periplasmic adaptor subunit, partial [Moraxellaceae bacterium]
SIPEGALQTLEGKTVVFVADADGLEPREVTLGRRSAGRVEVLAGFKAGERFAATGSFVLKAELQKGEAEHEH